MSVPSLSTKSQQVEALLDSAEKNPISDFLRQEASRQVEAKGAAPSTYDIFAIRRNDQFGEEIFGPKQLHVGSYTEETLYGVAGSPVARFRSAIEALNARVEKALTISPEDVEYGHQVALFWAEVGRLKEFIGATLVLSEIVAELRTARFQFLGKDTPPAAMSAVSSALRLVTEAKSLNALLADQVVETLQRGSIDSLAPDSLRRSNA